MNKSILTFLILLGAIHQVLAQGPLIDRKGTAYFFSEAPLEDIEATNSNVIGAVDLTKGTLAVSMFMKDFGFDKSLMQEHFNENYLESEKFPKATFKGVIVDFSNLDFSKNGKIEAEAKGEINIHGVTKPLTAPVTFEVSTAKLSASTVFNISIADFDIEIPRLVIQNIAEVVEVKASFIFTK